MQLLKIRRGQENTKKWRRIWTVPKECETVYQRLKAFDEWRNVAVVEKSLNDTVKPVIFPPQSRGVGSYIIYELYYNILN